MKNDTFHKAERLKSRKTIEQLFQTGQSFGQYPLRLVYMSLDTTDDKAPPIQLAVSVPKRKFPKAVQRNRIKRQIKEAWRLNKSWLYNRLADDSPRLALMIIYVAKEPLPYIDIESAIKGMTRRILKKHQKNTYQPKTNK